MERQKKQDFRVKIGNQEDITQLLTASVMERLGNVARPVTAQEAQKYGIELQQAVAIRWLDSKGTGNPCPCRNCGQSLGLLRMASAKWRSIAVWG